MDLRLNIKKTKAVATNPVISLRMDNEDIIMSE